MEGENLVAFVCLAPRGAEASPVTEHGRETRRAEGRGDGCTRTHGGRPRADNNFRRAESPPARSDIVYQRITRSIPMRDPSAHANLHAAPQPMRGILIGVGASSLMWIGMLTAAWRLMT